MNFNSVCISNKNYNQAEGRDRGRKEEEREGKREERKNTLKKRINPSNL